MGGIAGDTATLMTLDCSSLEHALRSNSIVSEEMIALKNLMMYSKLSELIYLLNLYNAIALAEQNNFGGMYRNLIIADLAIGANN